MSLHTIPPHLAPFTEPRTVLDHGYVRLLGVMGDDEDIEADARVSYEGQRKRSETRTLLRYCLRHRHTSPFEQAVIKLDIKLPIFVARQLVRHRTQSLNEVSARYTELPEEFYIPEGDQVCYQSTKNKQGRAGPLDPADAQEVQNVIGAHSINAFAVYHNLLQTGVARETSRFVLPLNTYTHWHTTMNAHNLLHMLKLRLDPHAQWEIRQYAEAIADIVKVWLPITWAAFEDYVLDAVTLSKQEVEYLRGVCLSYRRACLDTTGTSLDQDLGVLDQQGMSRREIDAFRHIFFE